MLFYAVKKLFKSLMFLKTEWFQFFFLTFLIFYIIIKL